MTARGGWDSNQDPDGTVTTSQTFCLSSCIPTLPHALSAPREFWDLVCAHRNNNTALTAANGFEQFFLGRPLDIGCLVKSSQP